MIEIADAVEKETRYSEVDDDVQGRMTSDVCESQLSG